jgi:hypothetical protein
MKKLIIFLLVVTFGFAMMTTATEAGLWSQLFSRNKTEQAQNKELTDKTFWSKVRNIFNEKTIKPTPPPILETKLDTEKTKAKIKALKNISEGKHTGQKNLNFTFTQEEINKVVTPYLKDEIKNSKEVNENEISLKSIELTEDGLELTGNINKIIKGEVFVKLNLSNKAENIKVDISKVKYKKFPLPKILITKILEAFKVDPNELNFTLPNTKLESLKITPEKFNATGVYTK